MHNFKELTVWQKSVDFAVTMYKITNKLPSEEKFGLTNQLRRSAVSISANIAEGAVRRTGKDFYHFLGNALGSSFECEAHLIISFRLDFIAESEYKLLADSIYELQKMIHGLQKSLGIKI
jgi:four helix bundle protein